MIPSHDFLLQPKSDMVICCLGVGENHEKALQIMKPTVEYYGKLHNIDTLFFTESFLTTKLAKKNKIFLLANLLKYYKTVMWMDSDTIIVNPKEDIRKELQSDHVVYMTSYFGRKPLFPNSGVIVAKRDPMTFEILEKVWNFKRKNKRGWWDQQGFLKLLGFKNRLVKILTYNGPTKYTPYIGSLDVKWNSRPNRKDVSENPVIMHHCGIKFWKRIERMEKSYQLFLKNSKDN
ncbi:glycosyltransferase family 77 protein [Metabacillus litoralis]|uniref:Glycosyltransferase family 77 protein n=1 Tax=Metabacillus litoralis TaxID=152268 RepID=A0A5C6W4E0_9BACI|nr:putative nucleotide-diphospho-sugar transferase [Metabacillus litoralis]TXC92796.1 glycosyltransferase family 77 protein [Metabacillus litoralis]